MNKMNNKILLDNNSDESGNNNNNNPKKEILTKPNLFQGRTDSEKRNAKFPEWDIVPPNQFINPRIKQQ